MDRPILKLSETHLSGVSDCAMRGKCGIQEGTGGKRQAEWKYVGERYMNECLTLMMSDGLG